MLKKIFPMLLVSSVLFGCGEKKEVTEDMLIGKWTCTTLEDQIYHQEKYQSYNKHEKYGPYILTFKKDKNKMTRQYESLRPEEFYFKRLDDTGYSGVDGNVEYGHKVEYIFISDDEFKVAEQGVFRYRKSKEITETHDFIKTCIRIKSE